MKTLSLLFLKINENELLVKMANIDNINNTLTWLKEEIDKDVFDELLKKLES